MMGQEIERKFLVRSDAWREGAVAHECRQGYMATAPGSTVRVRLLGGEAFLTLKGPTDGISRLEFEYPIPFRDGVTLLEQLCARPLIEKRRHTLEYAGLTWEVDEFLGDNQGLIVAEVELDAETQGVDLPPWVGQEVSRDPRYRNSALARNPYTTWAGGAQPA